MGLFQFGDFTLNSGAKSLWKLECDALTDEDWKALARMVHLMVGPFSSVEGVPRGGLKLAEHLKPLTSKSGPHPIVDDVLTTGGSLTKAYDAYLKRTPGGLKGVRRLGDYPTGAVVFARGPCPFWVKAVFQMPECFWVQPKEQR
jgi:orotate phosphoribosyltransferase